MGFRVGRTLDPTYKPHQEGSVTSPPGCVTGLLSSKHTQLKPASFSRTWPIANTPSPGEWPCHHPTGPAPRPEPGIEPGPCHFPHIPPTTKPH